jgi:hypothetical protein
MDRRSRLAPYILAIGVGLTFGALDQYIGSLSPTGAAISNLSAPWLLLAFTLGYAQDGAVRAAAVASTGLVAAVAGFAVMTMSPLEGVHSLAFVEALRIVWSQARWIGAAACLGPLYGFLGHLWRQRRSLYSAMAAGGLMLLEPLARVVGLEWGPVVVDYGELIIGAALATYFIAAICRPRAVTSTR